MPTRSYRPFQKTDKRLLGTWKSDDKRTMAEWTWKKNLSSKRKRLFKSIFGKLVVIYRRNEVISKKQSIEFVQRYEVLGSDETSVAIVLHGGVKIKNLNSDPDTRSLMEGIFSESVLQHIHFSGNHFWISFGKNREFFRKLRNRKT